MRRASSGALAARALGSRISAELAHPPPGAVGRLGGLSRRAALIKSGDILCQEIVEHGADNSDDGKFCNVFPSGCDRSAHYVGGKRKFERKQNPSSEFEPDLAAFDFASLSTGDHLQQRGHGLKAAESHDKHRAALDGERSVARDHVEVTFKCGVQAPSLVVSHLKTGNRSPTSAFRPAEHGSGGFRFVSSSWLE